MMKVDIPEAFKEEIARWAKAFELDRVVLFGSRARGCNWERSDVDIAISGGFSEKFRSLASELLDTPLMVDVVNLDEDVSDALIHNILRDGVLIYAKN